MLLIAKGDRQEQFRLRTDVEPFVFVIPLDEFPFLIGTVKRLNQTGGDNSLFLFVLFVCAYGLPGMAQLEDSIFVVPFAVRLTPLPELGYVSETLILRETALQRAEKEAGSCQTPRRSLHLFAAALTKSTIF